MGKPMTERLSHKGWKVSSFDAKVKGTEKSIKEMMQKLPTPCIVWIMIPAGKLVDQVLQTLSPFLWKGDMVIDGGNSFYKDSMRRAKRLAKKGIQYLDVGISGGPVSIKLGRFAIMVGGKRSAYERVRSLFQDLSNTPSQYLGRSGAGHFTKMIHNGIEYGMMQALAEGFTVLRKAPFKFRLRDVANVYNQNSIITSRLTGWLEQGFKAYGENLKEASGTVAHTGEGEWTVKTAKEMRVKVPVIEKAFQFRIQSKKKPSFTGKILSTLRAVFGGHTIK